MNLKTNPNYINYLTIIIIILFFQFGYFFSNFNELKLTEIEIPLTNSNLFVKVLVQNTTFYLLIILGSLFFNISSLMLICYNSFAWGYSAKMTICQIGFIKTFFLIGPHISIEIFWIIYSTSLSFDLSLSLLSFFNNNISASIFMISIRNKIKLFLYGYLVVLLGCIVEIFVSPLIYKLL